jgi:hypothetical protein
MTTATHRRTPRYGSAELPDRQVMWTRLGHAMGYTNTEARRAEIRTAIDVMTWRDPGEVAGLLDTAPARQVIAVLLGGRRWALHRVAATTLPSDLLWPVRRLLAIEAVTWERYVLLDDCGYEWIHLCTDRPAHQTVGASR